MNHPGGARKGNRADKEAQKGRPGEPCFVESPGQRQKPHSDAGVDHEAKNNKRAGVLLHEERLRFLLIALAKWGPKKLHGAHDERRAVRHALD
jgi:hypothetical protein